MSALGDGIGRPCCGSRIAATAIYTGGLGVVHATFSGDERGGRWGVAMALVRRWTV